MVINVNNIRNLFRFSELKWKDFVGGVDGQFEVAGDNLMCKDRMLRRSSAVSTFTTMVTTKS